MKSACGMFLSGCGSLSLQKSVYYIHYMNTFFIERITKKPFQNDLTSFWSACTDVKLAISKTVLFFFIYSTYEEIDRFLTTLIQFLNYFLSLLLV